MTFEKDSRSALFMKGVLCAASFADDINYVLPRAPFTRCKA
jgi:hypothetical protein